jgi:hypothetical protein
MKTPTRALLLLAPLAALVLLLWPHDRPPLLRHAAEAAAFYLQKGPTNATRPTLSANQVEMWSGSTWAAAGFGASAGTFAQGNDSRFFVSDVQVYTSGSGTWTRPAAGLFVDVIMYGGGGGGGSGRKAVGVSVPGGSGGGAGGHSRFTFRRTDLGITESYSVGTGGAGGTSVSSANTNGNDGTSGGDSTFGTKLIAAGGSPGRGGAAIGSQTGGTGGAGMHKGGDGQTNDGSCAIAAISYGAPSGGAQGGGVGVTGFAYCSSAASPPGGVNVSGGTANGGTGASPGALLPGGGGGGGDGALSGNPTHLYKGTTSWPIIFLRARRFTTA